MAKFLKGCALCTPLSTLVLALLLAGLQRTTWWAAYDVQNCETCKSHIDWKAQTRESINDQEMKEFTHDGVTILKAAVFNKMLIDELGEECDRIPDTFLTNIVANFLLRFYRRYEHRLESRSELLRDWAVHGPFGKWAAQLLNATEIRLYNTELIFHRGDESPTCKPAWHRDTVAAPFDPEVPSAVFNIFLHDIDAEHDGLIYVRGSHLDPSSMPGSIDIIEPRISVGDVLVHSANAYHASSGRGCFNRRSLQFRYFAGGAKLSHGPQRQSGPIPWTFAHAPGIAPHGLKLGDSLQGPFYPLVFPQPLKQEQRSVPEAETWGFLKLGSFISKSMAYMNSTEGEPTLGLIVMDGVVKKPEDWYWKEFGESGMVLPAMKMASGLAS